jgi:hypothetical protein
MTQRGKWALLLASTAVAAFVSAPAASAEPECDSAESALICKTNGSASIKATPGTLAPPANQPAFPWMGTAAPGAE